MDECFKVKQALIKKDHKIIALWLAIKEVKELNQDTLSDEDLDLWMLVSRHSVIQNQLKNNPPGGKKEPATILCDRCGKRVYILGELKHCQDIRCSCGRVWKICFFMEDR